MYRMGTMLNFGKFWMYDRYYLTGGSGYPWGSDVQETKITFEMGTWFGDPTMQIWTEFPEILDVSYPDTILLGDYSFSVVVTSEGVPVESVLVCLTNDEVYRIDYTNASGVVDFSLSTSLEGSMHLTATKHNCSPHQGSVEVVYAPYMCGDANGDSLIDASDVVFLVNYLFRGDSAPFPYEAGDANCDGIVETGDLVYLLNFLYREGPAPGCP
jgi:hypothetical protein